MPASRASTCLVVKPVACTAMACAGTVWPRMRRLSSVDCVEKLQLSTTSAGFTPTAWPINRCPLNHGQSAANVALLMPLQFAGAFLTVA